MGKKVVGTGRREDVCSVVGGGADGENNRVVFHPPPEGSDTLRRIGRKEEGKHRLGLSLRVSFGKEGGLGELRAWAPAAGAHTSQKPPGPKACQSTN